MSDLIGRKLGKYTLEERLGEGGMAAVYRSHHPQFDRPVAIKILPPTVGQDPSFRARFEREGRTIASLNHPNIVRIYDIDESDGLFYMVMDLLPGGTLESRLREGGLDRKWSAGVVVKMAEALEYAHSRGVIHRDIKPSNILLDAEGQPILADFGIARLVEGQADGALTSAGTIMGTPAYMAPEQLTGQPPDARADIYSLGIVLYQLLAGRAPFTGDTMAIVTAHLTRQPPALREYVPDLPPALDAVVLQALAKQPEHRFKSAGVFAQALRNAAADLEPAIVRVVSATPELAASSFGAAALPRLATSAGRPAPAAPQPALSTGQQVTRYLPIALSVLGLLLVISWIAQYWTLAVLLLILIGGGGFAFLYFRARAAGRRAAEETTRAITSSVLRAAPATAALESTPREQPPAVALDERDDVPELPLPEDAAQAVEPALVPAGDLPPVEAIPLEDDLPPTASGTIADDLPPTESIPQVGAGDLPPTEATRASEIDPAAPTESMPIIRPDEEQSQER